MGAPKDWFGRFFNPHQRKIRKSSLHFLLWQLGFYKERKPPTLVPKHFKFPNPKEEVSESIPKVTWINHSTFLIEADGISLLVDPIWSKRCSPLSFFGPKRRHPSSPTFEELKKIDYVCISHNHYDHLDHSSVKSLHARFPNLTWIMPLGLGEWFRRHFPAIEAQSKIELDWWSSFASRSLQFTAVPAQHYSGRGILDKNRTLWMGILIKFYTNLSVKQVYYAGDTGYNTYDFKKIGRFGPFDLSILPIGVYEPRDFMCTVHVNPQEAILIHKEVESKFSVASHWKTFRLSDEAPELPPFDLFQELQKAGISPSHFRVLEPGQTLNW